ncbi:hypothetical protein BJV85_002557 [Clostridium acetobutylicum]|uniref:Uncharacterized protein n=1 Tax=Clostridium acetobutylicum (strain ATCC 824 / DSM 792 / JCM 1419 / IAM 19013 / LMG 5710 / NBRC 13948 / NRRL B-527 / VKM B-1787 / 2291 / W) TaxID=272562 RepID=Q97J48_CLOAB|nr:MULTISPECIES: hypothetical protein [Clostridium]AAK79406.1 Hypothetical protein CA_C1438 [Clostridium acetobutylicum ATCC 824]ADZ20491.1 Conserved hypothetical protein [Clostridium acetobutylicum EA 2018]AEI31804.1 hypothetical protein SMB_G1463 [Clostridium acetobutylicum DSM 1731]AWV81345.1 hypothetical protein DK921_14845 [Clostridium acetobutylicum]MBC2392979.1 hypothetical protein [Clostridium acetobutylicum]
MKRYYVRSPTDKAIELFINQSKIKRREVKEYGIKICNPKHGKDIWKLRVCW